MKVIVFLGPTLAERDARLLLDAQFVPPAERGDVYLAARAKPDAIALVDGYFDQVSAVWHKEILWAMSQGVHVFGAASMGALRACELHAFGMRGVGRIFEDFASGTLVDDDEVVLAHASAEQAYRPLSEAMVNIRATLGAAARAGILNDAQHAQLVGVAKELFYPDRSYPRLLAVARAAGFLPPVLDALRDWLPTGRVDQKRRDACELLETLAASAELLRTPKLVDFELAETDAWLGLRQGLEESCV